MINRYSCQINKTFVETALNGLNALCAFSSPVVNQRKNDCVLLALFCMRFTSLFSDSEDRGRYLILYLHTYFFICLCASDTSCVCAK